MSAVVFDALGTLFDLEPLREQLGAAVQDAWFERLLHSAVALTAAGEFVPFDSLAASTLRTTLAKLELDHDPDPVLGALGQLPAHGDARPALERAHDLCDMVVVLTNGGRESTEALLEQNGLATLVDEVRSVEEVRAYKPDPRAYALVPRESRLVAAHAWDVIGAAKAGLDAVWVNRLERVWPFGDEISHHQEAPDLVSALRV